MKKEIIIYQSNTGEIEFKGDFNKDTLWATQSQISDLFEIDRSVVTKHIRNILKDKELDKDSVCAKFAHTADDGKTYQVQHYNLDILLAVGYRANSTRAIQFRQWATKTLREHIVKGYTINRKRIGKNYQEFLKAVDSIKKFLPSGDQVKAGDALELVRMFANTWLSLDAYDKSDLPTNGATIKQTIITSNELNDAISDLKQELLKKDGASPLFAQEREKDSVSGIVGNVFQSAFGQEAYETMEEKAAHLLYFFVKNHPFVDGNKRSGAFAFVWFLSRAGLLRKDRITPEALTTLTLLVAESSPKDKDRIIGLILQLLKIG